MMSAYLHSLQEILAELRERGFFEDCSDLVTDHRRLKGAQDVFLAVPGAYFDPRNLVDDLLRENRCGLVLVEYDERRVYQSASVVPVSGLQSLLGDLACAYYENPSHHLTVFAVTGTNGKTTVTRWLAQALNRLGKKAAVIGTLGYGLPDQLQQHSTLTTPDAVGMQRILHEMKRNGFDCVCIEASSIGLAQQRMFGVEIDCTLFTNFTQDHLDYHLTMSAYAESKMMLARWPGVKVAVANQDAVLGDEFLAVAASHGAVVCPVGKSEKARVCLNNTRHGAAGLSVELLVDNALYVVESPVVGDFNAGNLALVFAALIESGFDAHAVATALGAVTPAPGRMQEVANAPSVVIDYAHTPDALEKALLALRPMATERGGKLTVVFGCGGDRDKTKRPLMGSVAAQLADFVFVTADNPRSEDVDSIVKDILSGVPSVCMDKVLVQADRALAIQNCLMRVGKNDVVLIAGKGHETTQTIGGVMHPYSDFDVARQVLVQKGAA